MANHIKSLPPNPTEADVSNPALEAFRQNVTNNMQDVQVRMAQQGQEIEAVGVLNQRIVEQNRKNAVKTMYGAAVGFVGVYAVWWLFSGRKR